MKENIKLLIELFTTFFKIGSFTFGGGFAMIPLIEKEVVDKRSWVKKEEIIDVFAVSQTIPGAVAINSSSIIGYKIAGKKGSIVATLGVVLPSFLIIIIIAACFSKFQDQPMVKAAFSGIRGCVVGLIAAAAYSVGKSAIKDKMGVIIFITTVIFIAFFNVNPIIMIVAGGLVGFVLYQFTPKFIDGPIKEGDKK